MYRRKVSLKATNLVMADRECINKGGVMLFDWFLLRKMIESDLPWILMDIQYIAVVVMWITSREFCQLFNQTMIASFLLLKGFRTLPLLVCSARMYNLDALPQRDKKWVNILDVMRLGARCNIGYDYEYSRRPAAQNQNYAHPFYPTK